MAKKKELLFKDVAPILQAQANERASYHELSVKVREEAERDLKLSEQALREIGSLIDSASIMDSPAEIFGLIKDTLRWCRKAKQETQAVVKEKMDQDREELNLELREHYQEQGYDDEFIDELEGKR